MVSLSNHEAIITHLDKLLNELTIQDTSEASMMFVGADGCRAGWFAVQIDSLGGWNVGLFVSICELWDKYSTASLILLDVPIGLSDEPRECDVAARKLLGRTRASSVFPPPCPDALYAKTYDEAKRINEQRTSSKLTIQTWNIVCKIRKVYELLLTNQAARKRIREIHPEVCFWALSGGRPMEHKKRKVEGFQERRKILEAAYPQSKEIIDYALHKFTRTDVKKDDILDALVAVVTARLGAERGLASIPDKPRYGFQGLPMEMVYCINKKGVPPCR